MKEFFTRLERKVRYFYDDVKYWCKFYLRGY